MRTSIPACSRPEFYLLNAVSAMTSQSREITFPAEWWDAFQEQADREGMELSQWIGDACKGRLTQDAVSKLSEPSHEPHRPHHTRHTDPGNDLPRGAKG